MAKNSTKTAPKIAETKVEPKKSADIKATAKETKKVETKIAPIKPEVKPAPAKKVTEAKVPDVKPAPAKKVTEAKVPDVKPAPAKKVTEAKVPDVKPAPAKKVTEAKVPDVKPAPAKKVAEVKVPEVKPAPEAVVETKMTKAELIDNPPAVIVNPSPKKPKKTEKLPVVVEEEIHEIKEVAEEKIVKAELKKESSNQKSSKPAYPNIKRTSYPDKINYRLTQIYYHLNIEKVKGVYVNYLPNIKYITGFTGSAADLIIFKDSIHFFTDDRYEEQIKEELYPLPNLQVHITRDLWSYVEQIGLLNDVDAIIFESDRVSYYDAVEFRNRIRPCKFKPVYNLIEPFTTSKASEEVELIQKSCRIAESVYNDILKFIKPGVTEKEVANEISYLGRKYGSEGEAFDIIVTSGPRGAIIHGQPSDKKIRKGDIVLMDFGFKVRGFSSDISRTVCVGAKPTREQKHLYATLREAEMKVIRAVLPGMNGKTMDLMVRKVINDAGYEEIAYKHSLGHGLGIMTHERPFLNSRQDGQIVPEDGVLAIEPGAYIPDKYGMRVEDNVLVTKNGAVMLTNAPDELPYIL